LLAMLGLGSLPLRDLVLFQARYKIVIYEKPRVGDVIIKKETEGSFIHRSNGHCQKKGRAEELLSEKKLSN